MTPPDFALLNSGLFLLAGMITGAWKHQKILHSPQRRAPVYVDIAHRASLMYSFATLVIWKLAETAPFPVAITWYAVVAPVAFFRRKLQVGFRDVFTDLLRDQRRNAAGGFAGKTGMISGSYSLWGDRL